MNFFVINVIIIRHHYHQASPMIINFTYTSYEYEWKKYFRIYPGLIIIRTARTLKTHVENPKYVDKWMQHNKTVDVQCDRPMKWLNLHDGLIYKFSYGDCYVRGYVRASQCCPYVYCRYWILPLKNCRHVSHRGIISHRIILVIKN